MSVAPMAPCGMLASMVAIGLKRVTQMFDMPTTFTSITPRLISQVSVIATMLSASQSRRGHAPR